MAAVYTIILKCHLHFQLIREVYWCRCNGFFFSAFFSFTKQEFRCTKDMRSFNSQIRLMLAMLVMAKTAERFLVKCWVSVYCSLFVCLFFRLSFFEWIVVRQISFIIVIFTLNTSIDTYTRCYIHLLCEWMQQKY